MSKRPTPPYRSLTENPKWAKMQCERCGVDYWLEHGKVGKGFRYCTSTCRYEPPLAVIEKRTVKEGHPKGCWICSLTPTGPYPVIKTKGDTLRVARVVLEHSLGRPIGENMKALHKCNEPRCVRVGPEHIYEGTQQENIQWCVESGRHVGNRFLSDAQIIEIRSLEGKMSAQQVAPLYGAAESTIYNIWLHYNRPNV